MSKFDYFIAAIISGKHDFEALFDAAVEVAEKAKAEAKKSFIGDRLAAELKRIENDKDNAIKEAKRQAMEAVSSRAAGIREEELKSVSMSAGAFTSLVELEKIREMRVTATEFKALCQRFGGGSNYWARKMLGEIAAKNGLPYAAQLSVDEKLGILSQLTRGFADYLDLYNGHGKTDMSRDDAARAFAAVSDAALTRAAARYTAADAADTLNDDRAARCCYENIRGLDSYNAGMRLRNFFSNCNDNMKNRLMFLLIADTEIPAQALSIAGIDADSWRVNYGERLEDYREKEKVLEALKKDPERMAEAIKEDKHGFLLGMIQSESRSNEGIKAEAEELGLVEGDNGSD